jgi:hypothetical protein
MRSQRGQSDSASFPAAIINNQKRIDECIRDVVGTAGSFMQAAPRSAMRRRRLEPA